MSPLAGVVEPSSVTVSLPARNEPAADFSTVAAAACSVLYWPPLYCPPLYCPPPGWLTSPPLSPCGTAVLLLAEPQPATAAQAASAQAPATLARRRDQRGIRMSSSSK